MRLGEQTGTFGLTSDLYFNINGIIPRCFCCLSERRDYDCSPVSRVWVELKERESLNKRKKKRNGEGAGFHFAIRAGNRENSGIRILSFWFNFDFRSILVILLLANLDLILIAKLSNGVFANVGNVLNLILQQCSKGGCHGVCDSRSCLQLCDAGNCTMECMQCQHNCTGGGCNLTCPDGALCKLHCGAHQNCTITIKVKRRKFDHLTATVSRISDEHDYSVTDYMAKAYCAINPIICFMFSSNYWKALKRLIKCSFVQA